MAQTPLPSMTIVIPTNGGRAEIIARMLPVLLADPATSEVIVAFDREDPATREVTDFHARSDERVRTIYTGGDDAPSLTCGQAAREAAVRTARGEVVLSLDDDVEPEPGLVSGHARRHAEDAADSAVLGYMPVSRSERSRLSAPVRLYAEAYEESCSRFLADETKVLTGFWAGNFSLPRDCWTQAGRATVELDYHDDREFGLRLLQAGIHGTFDRELRAAHRYQRTSAQVLQDAQSSGRAWALLHRAYPELAPSPQAELDAASALGRPFVWLSRSRLGRRVTTGILLALSQALGAIGLSSAEYAVTKLLWRVGFARGVRVAG